jgi:ATP-dependent DNA helicase RecQ
LEAVAPSVKDLADALRQWRLDEARRQEVPAYCILSNRTLLAVVEALPGSEDELLEVKGIGPTVADRYGLKILELVREQSSPQTAELDQGSEV